MRIVIAGAGIGGRAAGSIPTLHTALSAGHPVDVEVSGIAADSLGARRLLGDRHRIAIEHGTAAALALGGADRSLQLTREHLARCSAFGARLAGLPAVRHRVTDLATNLAAARELVYHSSGGTSPTTWIGTGMFHGQALRSEVMRDIIARLEIDEGTTSIT